MKEMLILLLFFGRFSVQLGKGRSVDLHVDRMSAVGERQAVAPLFDRDVVRRDRLNVCGPRPSERAMAATAANAARIELRISHLLSVELGRGA